MSKTANRAYAATAWISKFAYLNLLWLGFSLVGLVVLGFFPATIAMFSVVRKWLMGETDIAVFSMFWSTYKAEFLRSNGLGLIIVVVGSLIVLDLVFIKNSGGNFVSAIQIPIYLFAFAAVLTTMYVFPVFVHYELKVVQIIKNSFLLMTINPLENLVMLISLVTVFFVVKYIPGLGFFFGGSILATIIMAACLRAFQKMEEKRKR
ncbi:YesL family protein [Bacillus sp. REN16]|uniref:YesL family protein n=1 Tax=Bacillus sp. REN16 TaxID=2887296 RepID=UPI001E5BAA10|nr:YesL family protein [Bacillus sp. REN16]MCC3357890.1 YesL family protein [Bacillus sp. REN16]